jgi:hypothetical protein
LDFANTKVLAVPKSIARSEEKRLNSERTFIEELALGSLLLWYAPAL